MKPTFILLSLFFLCMPGFSQKQPEWFSSNKIWELPPSFLQVQNPGVAGVFSGIADGKLIVAGGANFPDKKPWEGGVKNFSDKIYILNLNDKGLSVADNIPDLPEPVAYGASVPLPEGVLCIGGNNREGCSARVFLLGFDKSSGDLTLKDFPDLPVPLSYFSAVLLKNCIYVIGGSSSPDGADTGNYFFKLDLSKKATAGFVWEKLPDYPGIARIYSVAAVQSDGVQDCIFLFSGRNYQKEKGVSVFNDGMAYNPLTQKWKAIDSPGPAGFTVMAGTALPVGSNSIVFFGGAPGELLLQEQELRKKLSEAIVSRDTAQIHQKQSALVGYFTGHPGFSKDILLYNTITNTLTPAGKFDFPCPVTTNAVPYKNGAIITSGETKPGVRTPDIFQIKFNEKQYSFGWLNSFVLFLYFFVLVIIGYVVSKKQKNTDDYFKGGGRIPWWAAGISLFGTALSAITFMAIPAKTYAADWSYFLFNMSIFLVAPLVIFLFIPFYRNLNVTTAYEYLEKRFNLVARLVGSISFILFQIGRMGVILLLPSLALNVVTGMDVFLCIVLMGIVSLVYTMMGGIEAVIWTDVLQVIVLLAGAIIALGLMVGSIDGGVGAVFQTAAENKKFNLINLQMTLREPSVWVMLIGGMFTQLTTYGTDQTMVQRYLTTKTEKEARRGVWTNAWMTVPASILFFAIGTTLFVFYRQYPALSNPALENIDSIFPWYIVSQLPNGLSGLLIAGIFAAAMSSLSSSMNSISAAYSSDIHFRFFPDSATLHLKTARRATLVAGLAGTLFAVFMATWNIQSLWDEFNRLLGLIIGGLGGLFLLGILTRKANGAGAVIGIIASILVQILVSRYQAVHLLLYTASGVISCFVFGWLGSLCLPNFKKPISGLTIYSVEKHKSHS